MDDIWVNRGNKETGGFTNLTLFFLSAKQIKSWSMFKTTIAEQLKTKVGHAHRQKRIHMLQYTHMHEQHETNQTELKAQVCKI